MAGWGMGNSLEKNLRKVQSFREKGQLDRALKQLQDWAQKHPDTPHYLYEAAMVAFDLEDWTTGINSLRTLVRQLPDTRDRVIGACRDRFTSKPVLSLGEFLVEADLSDGEFTNAFETVITLPEKELSIYRRKSSMRHQSLLATQSTPQTTLQASHSLQFVLACAAGDSMAVADACHALLESDEAMRDRLDPVLRQGIENHGEDAGWLFALASHKRAAARPGEAARSAAEAARRSPDQLERARDLVESCTPDDESRGQWLCARGDLAVLAHDGAGAAQMYVESADADASLRDELIDRIQAAETDPAMQGIEDLLKLHLRLLTVQKRFDDIPPLAQRLTRDNIASAQELRSLLGEGKSESVPSEMLVVLAETALRDGDISAAAKHAHEIPNADDTALQRLLRAVESLASDWPAETRLQLDALRAVLNARVSNREGANACLAELWEAHPEQIETLFAITERCFDAVEPMPFMLKPGLAAALDAAAGDRFLPWLLRLIPADAEPSQGPFGGFGGNPLFDQDNLDLDLGGSSEDLSSELANALVDILAANPDRGSAMIELLDRIDPQYGVGHRFRHPVALAALFSGDLARALPEFTVLTMMAPAEFLEKIGDHLDVALERLGDQPDLLISRAEVYADCDDIEAAAEALALALDADPSRADDLTQRFETLLSKVDGHEAAPLWRSFGEALFAAGRFDQLAELCGRALEQLPSEQVAPFLVLQARMLIDEGRLSEALQTIQQHMVGGRLPAERACELLEGILQAHPGSSIALIMMGQAATRAERIETAIDSYIGAVRLDRSLAAPVADQIQKIAARPGASGTHLMRIAAFHRENDDPTRAAESLDKALRLTPELAERVMGELAETLESDEAHLDLVQVAARASRQSGQVERASELLLRLDKMDPARFELVLAEFRQLREAHDDRLLPALCMARVLLNHNAPEAAAQTVVDASRQTSYALADRVDMLYEFQRRMPQAPDLAIALALGLGQQGSMEASVEHIRNAMPLRGFEAETAVDVVAELREIDGEHPDLRLLHHDLLVRVGRIDDALRVLPTPAALTEFQQPEISERLLEYRARVTASSELSLVLADSLQRQGRTEDAIQVLEIASEKFEARHDHELWTELARLLHASGRHPESQRILAARGSDEESRRAAYDVYAEWNNTRIEAEVRALRERHHARPQAAHIALSLAEKLLEAGRPHEVPDVLRGDAPNAEWRLRRAVLLGRAYLETDHADRAESVMLAALPHAGDDDPSRELHYRLAECADLLGRPAAATAHFSRLLDHPSYQKRAELNARRTYQHYIEDVAGEYRAVITRVSSL